MFDQMSKEKAIVLLSSGLDSSINLCQALDKYDVVMALTFDYGQKAAKKEIQQSKKISDYFNIKHKVMSLSWISELSNSSLTSKELNIPIGDQVQINNYSNSKKTAKSVWVPNRNGLFINIAAVFADSIQEPVTIVPGFNKEEAATFPDNSSDFIQAINHSLQFSTSNEVKTYCFTLELDKTEIVKVGITYKFPFDLIWPCYFDLDKWCGQCESCKRAANAFKNCNLDMKEYFV